MNKYLLLIFSLFLIITAKAQCTAGQKQVVVTIVPDNFPQETTWNLKIMQETF
jgi:hypothetical protein